MIKTPEEVRQWLEETYPAIEARRTTEKGRKSIGVTRSAWPRTSYNLRRRAMRRGEAATQDVPDPHIRAEHQISTITNHGEVRFMTPTRTQTMTAALFLVFLGRLLRSTTGKVFLIVDRLRAH